MRATTVAFALLLLFLCAGVLALGGYGGFEVFRLTSEEEAAATAVEKVVAQTQVESQSMLPRCDEGKLALAEKRFDAAADALETCVAAFPDDNEALFARGRAYAGLERFERAELDLSRALEREGSRADGWETLAWVRVRVGDDPAAIDALDHWIALNPAAGEAYRSRADARYRLGKPEDAVRDARRACDLGVADGCLLEERIRAVSR